MKALLLAALISLPVWSQSPPKDLYTPEDALKDINTGKLVFLGRQIFPGSGQNYTCAYRAESAYVLYNNCMASKKESAATDIEVLSFNGDIVSFFIQNADATIPVSATPRSEYSMTWRVSVTASPAVTDKLKIADLIKYKEEHGEVSGGCSIGYTFKAQDKNSKAFCIGKVKNPTWMLLAETFWLEPTEEWYLTQKYLRKVVEGTKF